MEALASGESSCTSQKALCPLSAEVDAISTQEDKAPIRVSHTTEGSSPGRGVDERKQEKLHARKRTHSDCAVTKEPSRLNTPAESKGEKHVSTEGRSLIEACTAPKSCQSGGISPTKQPGSEDEGRALQEMVGVVGCQRIHTKGKSVDGEDQNVSGKRANVETQSPGGGENRAKAEGKQRATNAKEGAEQSTVHEQQGVVDRGEGERERSGYHVGDGGHSGMDRSQPHTVSSKDNDGATGSCYARDRRTTKPESAAPAVEKRVEYSSAESVSVRGGGEGAGEDGEKEVLVEASPADGRLHRIVLSPPGVHTLGGKADVSSLPASLFIALGNRKETPGSSTPAADMCEAASSPEKASGGDSVSPTLSSVLPPSACPPCSSPSCIQYTASSPLCGHASVGLVSTADAAKDTAITEKVSFTVDVLKPAVEADFLSSEVPVKRGEFLQGEDEDTSFASQGFAEAENGFQKSEDGEDKDGKSEAASTTAGTTTCCTYTGGTTRRAMMMLMHETDSTSVVSFCAGGPTSSTSECPPSDSFSDSVETPLTVSLHPRAHSLSPLPSSPNQSGSVKDEAATSIDKSAFSQARLFSENSSSENKETQASSSPLASFQPFPQQKAGDKRPLHKHLLIISCDTLERQPSKLQKADQDVWVFTPPDSRPCSSPRLSSSTAQDTGGGVKPEDGSARGQVVGKEEAVQSPSLLSSAGEAGELSESTEEISTQPVSPQVSPDNEGTAASELPSPRCSCSTLSSDRDAAQQTSGKESSEESLCSSFASPFFTQWVQPDSHVPVCAKTASTKPPGRRLPGEEQERMLEYREERSETQREHGSETGSRKDEERSARCEKRGQEETPKDVSSGHEDAGKSSGMGASFEERPATTEEAQIMSGTRSGDGASLRAAAEGTAGIEIQGSLGMQPQDVMQRGGSFFCPSASLSPGSQEESSGVRKAARAPFHAEDKAKAERSWTAVVFRESQNNRKEGASEAGEVLEEHCLPGRHSLEENSSGTVRSEAALGEVGDVSCVTHEGHIPAYPAWSGERDEDRLSCPSKAKGECFSSSITEAAGELVEGACPAEEAREEGVTADQENCVLDGRKAIEEGADGGEEELLHEEEGSLSLECPPVPCPPSPASRLCSTSSTVVPTSSCSLPSSISAGCSRLESSAAPAAFLQAMTSAGAQGASVLPLLDFAASSLSASGFLGQKERGDDYALTKSSAYNTAETLAVQTYTRPSDHSPKSSQPPAARALHVGLSQSSASSSRPSCPLAKLSDSPSSSGLVSFCTSPNCPHTTGPSASAYTSLVHSLSSVENRESSPSSPIPCPHTTACSCLLSSSVCPAISPLTPACSSSASAEAPCVASSDASLLSLASSALSCSSLTPALSSSATLSSSSAYGPPATSSILGHPPHLCLSQPYTFCSSSSSLVSVPSSSLQRTQHLAMASLYASSEATTLCASPSPASSGGPSQVSERKPQAPREEENHHFWCVEDKTKATDSLALANHQDATPYSSGAAWGKDSKGAEATLPSVNARDETAASPACQSNLSSSASCLSCSFLSFPPPPSEGEKNDTLPSVLGENKENLSRFSFNDETHAEDASSCPPLTGTSGMSNRKAEPFEEADSRAEPICLHMTDKASSRNKAEEGIASPSFSPLAADVCPSLSVTCARRNPQFENAGVLLGTSENRPHWTASARDETREQTVRGVSCLGKCSWKDEDCRKETEGSQVLGHQRRSGDRVIKPEDNQKDVSPWQEAGASKVLHEASKTSDDEDGESRSLTRNIRETFPVCVTSAGEEREAVCGGSETDSFHQDMEEEKGKREKGDSTDDKELHAEEAFEKNFTILPAEQKSEDADALPSECDGQGKQKKEEGEESRTSRERKKERSGEENEEQKTAARSSSSRGKKESSVSYERPMEVREQPSPNDPRTNLFDRGFDSGVLVTHKEWSCKFSLFPFSFDSCAM